MKQFDFLIKMTAMAETCFKVMLYVGINSRNGKTINERYTA